MLPEAIIVFCDKEYLGAFPSERGDRLKQNMAPGETSQGVLANNKPWGETSPGLLSLYFSVQGTPAPVMAHTSIICEEYQHNMLLAYSMSVIRILL